MQVNNQTSLVNRANKAQIGEAASKPLGKIPGLATALSSALADSTIQDLNEQIHDFEQNGEPADGTLDKLRAERDDAITEFTGNPDPSAYDTTIVGRAQVQDISYNKAIDNQNRLNGIAASVAGGQPQETLEKVEQLPWEQPAVNARVDELNNEPGVDLNAAIVLAMTERKPTITFDSRPVGPFNFPRPTLHTPSIQGDWQSGFAQRVIDSEKTIENWAQDLTNTPTYQSDSGEIDVTMDGEMIVISDGTPGGTQRIDPATVDRIVIVGGDGNDAITVDESVTESLVIAGGKGTDTIVGGSGSDIILGGEGNDNLEGRNGGDIIIGGAGHDYQSGGNGNDVMFGGTGRDAMYGGNNEDILVGGSNNDYIDTGSGDDLAFGQTGDDVISGGRGDDNVDGGSGADTLIGASGDDQYSNLDDDDNVIAEFGETVTAPSGATVTRRTIDSAAGSSITIETDPTSTSSDEFETRVNDDLETLRATRTGNAMLNALDDEAANTGNSVTVKELIGVDNGFASANGADWKRNFGEDRATGGDSTVSYNPSYNKTRVGFDEKPPIAVLFHEFAHAYNMVTGTGLNGTYENGDDPADSRQLTRDDGTTYYLSNTERQAVGLAVDHDGDPRTAERIVPGHHFDLTENGFRRELGIADRPSYLRPRSTTTTTTTTTPEHEHDHDHDHDH